MSSIYTFTFGLPFCASNKIAECIVNKNQHSTITVPTVSLVGVAILASPLFMEMGSISFSAVLGTGLGLITGSLGSPVENKKDRDDIFEIMRNSRNQPRYEQRILYC